MERSNLMMVVIIILLVLLLFSIVGVAVFAFSAMQDLGNVTAIHQEFDRSPRALMPNEIGRLPVGEPVVTNVSGGIGGSGMARIHAVVGYDQTQGNASSEIARTLDDQMDFVRSIIIESINNRTYDELSGTEGMRNLSAEVLYTLQTEFRTNMIVDVTFREWVITR